MSLKRFDRLRALEAIDLLDSPAERALDRLTELATDCLNAPVSLISLVAEDKQFVKSSRGLPEAVATAREMPLSHSLCQQVVLNDQPLVIADARRDTLLCNNGAVKDFNVVAYLGVPIRSDGQTIGSFCVIDSVVRDWTAKEQKTVADFAALVETELQLRQALRESHAARLRSQTESQQLRDVLNALPSFVALLTPEGVLLDVNEAALQVADLELSDVVARPFWDTYWWASSTALQQEVKALVQRAAAGEAVTTRLTPQIAADERLDVDFNLKPVYDKAGQVVSLVASGVDITERLRAAEDFRQQQNQYQLALTAAQLGTWIWDLLSNKVRFDEANSALWGLPTATEMNVEEAFLIVYPDDRARLKSDLQAALAGEREYNSEFRVCHGTEIRCLAGRGAVLRDESGEAVQMLGVNFDVTERRHRERLLVQQSQMLASAHDAIIVWHGDGVIEAWNQGAEQLYGYSEAEALGQVTHDLLQTVHPLPKTELVQMLGAEGHWRGELQHTTKTGEQVIVSSRHQLIAQDSNEVVLEINRDVTARKLAEAEQAQSLAILEATPNLVGMVDVEGKLLYLNRAGRALLGMSLTADMNSYRLADLHSESGFETLKAGRKVALEQGAWTGESTLRDHTGREIPVLQVINVHKNQQGAVTHFSTIAQDLSERLKAEAEVRELNRTLEQRVKERTEELERLNEDLNAFNYSVSHDLRTPLRGIAGFSSALAKDYTNVLDDKGRHYLQRVVAGAERMGELIDDLLDLSRLSRGDLKRSRINLSAIAQEVSNKLCSYTPEREVVLNIAPDLYSEADYGLAYVVLENLFENAFKFTRDLAPARVSFGQQDRAFYVRDNGAGFDMAYRDKLFVPFQRLHNQQEFKGNGIGLATVRRIIQRHGGDLWATAEVGAGATFYFTFQSSRSEGDI